MNRSEVGTMRASGFAQGTAILVVAGLINRILGFGYRVVAIRMVGAEGIGLYEMVFPIYILLLLLATAGIPVTVAKLVAEELAAYRPRGTLRVLWLSLAIVLTTSTGLMLLLFFGAELLANRVFSDPRVYYPLVVMIPALGMVAIASVLRGYFQGLQNMMPPAMAQIMEQLIRVTLGLYLAYRMVPLGVEFAAMGVAGGMLLGEIGGLLVLALSFRRQQRMRLPNSAINYSQPEVSVRKIVALTAPLSLSRVVGGLSGTLQALIVPQRLQAAGLSLRGATQVFGEYSGVAGTLIHLPSIITMSLATSLVPAIAEAKFKGDLHLLRYRSHTALAITVITGLPSAVILYMFAVPVTGLLFNTPGAAAPLQVLAWGCVFIYLQQTTFGVLQGLGRVDVVFRHSLLGALVYLAGTFMLTGLPEYGIRGTAMAANLSAVLIALLNIGVLSREIGMNINLRSLFLGPLIATAVMGIVQYLLIQLLMIPGYDWGLIAITIVASIFVYLFVLLLTGTIAWKDVLRVMRISRRV